VRLQQDFKLHRLERGPTMLVTVKEQEALLYYRQLLAIRRLDWAATQLYKDKLIRGRCQLYTGQEACAVGMCAARRPRDNIIAGQRIHGLAHLMGLSALDVLAELLGRSTGCARGKSGSLRMYAPHFYGCNSTVGAQVPLATGIAWAGRYRGDESVCLAVYSDGAANRAQILECFKMAQLWKLPIVFVCENKNCATQRACPNTNYYTRGGPMPGIWVDAQDVLAVRSATRFAIEYVQQYGPLILQLDTYRCDSNSMSDPDTSSGRRQDALQRFRQLCLDTELLTQQQLLDVELEVRCEIDRAICEAKRSPELPASQIASDVYANGATQTKIRGILEHNLPHATSGSKQTT
ncbi:hypothetical protein KR222_004220, partial [Zaprionus bogoriensis]